MLCLHVDLTDLMNVDCGSHCSTLWIVGRFHRTTYTSRLRIYSSDSDDEGAHKRGLEHEARAGTFLADNLRLLPFLHSVIIDNTRWTHGECKERAIPLPVILSILATPQLRCFRSFGELYHPGDPIPERPKDLLLGNISAFEHHNSHLRREPRKYPSEAILLSILIPEMRFTLEHLTLPIENAPLQQMYLNDWPHLRRLTLYGERRTVTKPFLPYISILARMPALRSLHLLFANPVELPAKEIWPRGHHETFPWPALEELTITHPHPDDQLFTHLPVRMRSIALRCWPHHWAFREMRNSRVSAYHRLGSPWHTPLLSASEVDRIIRSCRNIHELAYLQLEYEIDDNEDTLLRHVAQSFPKLETLELYRYSPSDEKHVQPLVRHSEA